MRSARPAPRMEARSVRSDPLARKGGQPAGTPRFRNPHLSDWRIATTKERPAATVASSSNHHDFPRHADFAGGIGSCKEEYPRAWNAFRRPRRPPDAVITRPLCLTDRLDQATCRIVQQHTLGGIRRNVKADPRRSSMQDGATDIERHDVIEHAGYRVIAELPAQGRLWVGGEGEFGRGHFFGGHVSRDPVQRHQQISPWLGPHHGVAGTWTWPVGSGRLDVPAGSPIDNRKGGLVVGGPNVTPWRRGAAFSGKAARTWRTRLTVGSASTEVTAESHAVKSCLPQ